MPSDEFKNEGHKKQDISAEDDEEIMRPLTSIPNNEDKMQPFDIEGDDSHGFSYANNDEEIEGDFNSNNREGIWNYVPSTWYEWCFPSNVPRSVQLFRKENLAVPCCYLVVGLLQGLSGPLINVYPLDLGATEAQQATISSLRSLPASFKLAFGFLSDNLPIGGYRRKSYMFIGWLVTSLSMFVLLMGSNLSLERHEEFDEETQQMITVTVPDEDSPSVGFFSSCVLLFGTGFWFADVMGDSIVAEKAKLEPESSRGHLQSTCYACRFFGLMVAAPFSTVFYSTYGPAVVIKIMGLLPFCMLPLVYNFWEVRDAEVKGTREQCGEIWNTVCSRAVWQPMGFVYLYNILQVGNAAWREFLRSLLSFSANQLNGLYIIASVLLYLGIMAYKHYFIKWSWRSAYIFTTN
uniref:Uncharacterized protein n=1 Tax=Ditylum brightwellii TaxID=49249 RepID=A0A7S4QSJ8_9STRA